MTVYWEVDVSIFSVLWRKNARKQPHFHLSCCTHNVYVYIHLVWSCPFFFEVEKFKGLTPWFKTSRKTRLKDVWIKFSIIGKRTGYTVILWLVSFKRKLYLKLSEHSLFEGISMDTLYLIFSKLNVFYCHRATHFHPRNYLSFETYPYYCSFNPRTSTSSNSYFFM